MSQTIKFHLDENVNNAVADGLKRRGVDVTTTSQVGYLILLIAVGLMSQKTFGTIAAFDTAISKNILLKQQTQKIIL